MRDSSSEPAPPIDRNSHAPNAFPGELHVWLSPAFPVGSFAYSQGLETAVERGWINDPGTLRNWLQAIIEQGAVRNDLILMAHVLRATTTSEIAELAELAAALQPTSERAAEALDQGRNFLAAYESGWATRPSATATDQHLTATRLSAHLPDVTLPTAVALAARDYGFQPGPTLETYALAFISNLLSAAIRLGVIGQYEGQRLTAELITPLRATASVAATASLDSLGNATVAADIAAMLHETQTTRLFRS